MKFRKITLRVSNKKRLSWNPLDICKVEFHKDWIRINKDLIERKRVYYPHWRYLITQLTRIFEIEEFNIDYEKENK